MGKKLLRLFVKIVMIFPFTSQFYCSMNSSIEQKVEQGLQMPEKQIEAKALKQQEWPINLSYHFPKI